MYFFIIQGDNISSEVDKELRSLFKTKTIEWLLERNNPSVRYFTLTEILGKPDGDKEVIQAKMDIMKSGIVPAILSRQKEQGYWDISEKFYMSKYRGTVWQLIILAQLGADGNDKRIRKASEFIFYRSQDIESGGFSYRSAKTGGTHSGVFPCLTANLVWSFIRFGYIDDERVSNAIDWILNYQKFDDGVEKAPEGWPYDNYKSCWGKHTCHMGVVKSIKALTEIPAQGRNQRTNSVIKKGVDYLLEHQIFRRSHDLSRISKPKWLKFCFPLMWNTDVLEILDILTTLGYRDRRMQESIDLVFSKKDPHGRWVLENTYNERFFIKIENKRKPSKWITLKALKVLSGFYGINNSIE